MLNINLFGGPGTGKSTTAAGVFAMLKINEYKAELLQEYAKDLTYGEDTIKLSDQLHILGEQHHRLFRLNNKVDYVVHDSPVIMGLVYSNTSSPIYKSLKALTVDVFNTYNNLNIFLTRSDTHSYKDYGRSQTFKEAQAIDAKIRDMLNDTNTPFLEINMDDSINKVYTQIIKG